MITKQIEKLQALNEQDALLKAQELLNVSKNYLKALPISNDDNDLKTYTIMVKTTPSILGKEYLENILAPLELDLQMEYKTQEEGKVITYNLQSSNNGLLIGKNGANLDSVQYLLRQFLQSLCQEKLVVNVDVGGYRQKRIDQLERLAVNTAKSVLKTKLSTTLKNLTSFERRVIHSRLADWENLKTHSEGEGRERVLIISYHNDNKKE